MEAIRRMWETNQLNIQLPTGYGKTFTACACYAVKQRQGIDRVLFVFPSLAQLNQFIGDGKQDMDDAGALGMLDVVNVNLRRGVAAKLHKQGEKRIYAVTIQSLLSSDIAHTISSMMQTGNWMVVIDEYHHYGTEKAWGEAVTSLKSRAKAFLAMSATPYRQDDDSAFGKPDVVVTYSQACKEGAVKFLRGHAYTYTFDIVNETTGQVRRMTTGDLYGECGSTDSEAIDTYMAANQLRWHRGYVSAIVEKPLNRVITESARIGVQLQAIVCAMSCSHAKALCDQIRLHYPMIRIDWVGTSQKYGRTTEENEDVLRKFCPRKTSSGMRLPSLDVLVHVGMAGEGLDCTNVTEVIFVCAANINNATIQKIGRAARLIPFFTGQAVGSVSFDSSSPLAESGIGSKLMNVISSEPPDFSMEPEQDEPDPDIYIPVTERNPVLSDKPDLRITGVTLTNIDVGDDEILAAVEGSRNAGVAIPLEHIIEMRNDKFKQSPHWAIYREIFKPIVLQVKSESAESLNEEDEIVRYRALVHTGTNAIAKLLYDFYQEKGGKYSNVTMADTCKLLNARKARDCGKIENDISVCKAHREWVVRLEKEILSGDVPRWVLSFTG